MTRALLNSLIFCTMILLLSACAKKSTIQQYSILSKYDNEALSGSFQKAEILVTIKGDTLVARNIVRGSEGNYEVTNGVSQLVSQKLDSSYTYSCFLQNRKSGLQYKSLKAGKPILVDKDSVFNEVLYKVGETYAKISKTDVQKENTANAFIEKYKLIRVSPFEPDSIYYYFNKKAIGLTFMKDKTEKRFMDRMVIVFYQTMKNAKIRTFDFQILPLREPVVAELNSVLVRFRNDFHLTQ